MQTAGRAARNIGGTVILYADTITDSIRKLQEETSRRREIQREYNEEHGITPETIYKTVDEVLSATAVADSKTVSYMSEKRLDSLSKMEKEEMIETLEKEMLTAAKNLEFEKAAELRDRIEILREDQSKKEFRYFRRQE